MLGAACRQLRQWEDDGIDDLKLAVNLSGRQFLDPNLMDRIRGTLADHRVPAQRLEIELTETAAMLDRRRTRQIFGQLRDLGLSIAIDDFGTGYSSMVYLKDLPFDKLKIDREFVTDLHAVSSNQAICRALIELSHGLGLLVLAEGTEQREEVEMLHGMGCRLFQGFYFARPMPAEDFAQSVRVPELAFR